MLRITPRPVRDAQPRAHPRLCGPACALALAVVVLAPVMASAEPPTGRQIMEWVEDRDDGDNGVSDLEMILIDKRGNQRVREIRSYTRKFVNENREDDYGIMFFLSPADVKNTGFLTYDYDDPERDDDQWLYLPALKKTKRIASSDKSGSFMGSDFSYADMSSRILDRYQYTLMKEVEIEGVKMWQVEGIPNEKEIEETGYTKSWMFVRQDNFVVQRAVSWLKKGGRLKYMQVNALEQVDGIWVATELTMKTTKAKKTLHRTVIKVDNIKFNQGLDDAMFTVRRLEKGL